MTKEPLLTADDLWRVDLDESLGIEDLVEELANAGLDTVDRLVGERSQVDDSIVQLGVLLGNGHAGLLAFNFRAHGVLDEKWQTRLGQADHKDLSGVELNVMLRARLDASWSLADPAFHVDDALLVDAEEQDSSKKRRLAKVVRRQMAGTYSATNLIMALLTRSPWLTKACTVWNR